MSRTILMNGTDIICVLQRISEQPARIFHIEMYYHNAVHPLSNTSRWIGLTSPLRYVTSWDPFDNYSIQLGTAIFFSKKVYSFQQNAISN